MLYYIYNGDEVLGFVYNNNTYYYHKNVFGDILSILNSNYEEIVTYEYNSWGAISNITDNSGINLGTINPFRYRSYYYDEETKLYYLNSRYYNPEWGRFINGDSVLCSNRDVITSNIFCYVSNNPVNYSDEKGLAWMRPTKWLARKLWKVATAAMRKIGCPNAAKLLEHSLKDNPKDLTYGKNSSIAKKISKDKDYKTAMKKIIETADKNGNINYNSYKNKKLDGIEFENNADLFASLHGADIIVQGNVNDGKLKVQIIDYYDFKFEIDYSGGSFKKLAIIANNLAYLDQCTGVVNGYYIYINLEYKIN